MIYIYNGSGAFEKCVDAAEASLMRMTQTPKQNIVKCDLNGRLVDAKIIVLPGGNALEMWNGHFQPKTKDKVTGSVEEGARGVFLCAGALLMADNIHARGWIGSYVKGRQTGVTVKLPAYDVNYSLGDNPGKVAEVVAKTSPFSVYWNLGPSFFHAEHDVICRYDDIEGKPAACIESTFGSGKAVWSGVHPEFSHITGLFDEELKPHWDAQVSLLRSFYGMNQSKT